MKSDQKLNPNHLKRIFPHASNAFTNLNSEDSGVCPSEQEQIKRKPLERPTQGKKEGCIRFEIVFTIYSSRPLDWDNYWTKSIQDCLAESGIIHADDWNVLEGRVRSRKAHSKEEERTEIEIFQLCYE